VRFVDLNAYARPSFGGVLLGAYEQDPLMVDLASQPVDLQVADLELNQSMLERVAATIAPRFTPLQDIEGRLREVRGGLPTMTPDGFPLLGPVPAADGLFVIAGCCVGGFSISPSLGAQLADWIVDGAPSLDLSPLAVDRFGSEWTDEWLTEACLWEYRHVYDMRRDDVFASP
jgi:glycine/D-amino acid oxidase-like deaminating enzyme